MTRLRAPWEHHNARLGAYYSALNEWTPFRRDLTFAFARLDALETADLQRNPGWPSAYWDDDQYILLGQMLNSPVAAAWRAERARMEREYAMALLVRHIVDEFARRWRLPQGRGATDVWESYSGALVPWSECSEEPELWAAGVWSGTMPDLSTHSEISTLQRQGRTVRIVRPLVLIEPPTIPAIEYRPHMGDTHAALLENLRAHFASVECSVMEQAKRIDGRLEESGWRRTSPRYRGEDGRSRLLAGATRLFRRAVLVWGWERIADEEMAELGAWSPDASDTDIGDASSVRHTVESWAKMLSIPLPPLPRRQQPRAV